jgi:hypothetical protein
MTERTVNFSIDLEDTLEANKAPFIPVINNFMENNHPEVLEERGERYSSDQIENWGFEPFNSEFAEARGWDQDEEKDALLFIFGEHFMYDQDQLEQQKEQHRSVWIGFQEVMNNVFKGNPSNFPINDENASEYFQQLKDEFPESRADIVTARNDNETVFNRPEEYPISDDLRAGIGEYVELHGLDNAADNVIVASDKAGHENNYSVFFDDKPDLVDELEKDQYQVVHTTEANNRLDIPTYEEIQSGEAELGDSQQIRVYSVEEGFEAMSYIGNKIREGEA